MGTGSENKCTTPKSAALLFNNCTANGKHVAYAAYTTAVLVADAQAAKGGNALQSSVNIEAEEGAQIQQLRWVQLAMHEFFVVATTKNLAIYSANGSQLIHVGTAGSTGGPDAPPASFRGIGSCAAGSSEYICVGVSTGAVCLVPIPNPDTVGFGDSLLSPTSEEPIVDVTAGQAPHNDPSRALVCSAAADGQVLVHALEADGMWQHCCAFGASTHDETPSLVTSARMRGVHLYCAYSTGHVRVFDLVSCSMQAQFSAHARWINALEVHPNGQTFATASEDTTIGLWDFVDTPKVHHRGSINVTDALLSGVAFCGSVDRTHVCCTAYDKAAISAWKLGD